MGKDPWTDPDPQPGDFDAELGRARSDLIEIHEGNPDAKLSILVSVEGEDAKPSSEWPPSAANSPARSSPSSSEVRLRRKTG
jgi:hypothetical protein